MKSLEKRTIDVKTFFYRGADFRPDYRQLVNLRGVFTDVPLLGLSATVTAEVLADVKKYLQLRDDQIKINAVLPDRPNIFLEIADQKSFDVERDLRWLVNGLRKHQIEYQKTLVFAQSIRQVAEIALFLMAELGAKGFVDGGNDYTKRFVSMYHGHIGPTLQAFILDEFPKPDSVIRVLVSTVAFGMGVEIRDVRQVVHWGKCKSMLTYWQEVGRCGRDGDASRAIWYPQSVTADHKDLFSKLKVDDTACIRVEILKAFHLPGSNDAALYALSCKSQCSKGSQCIKCACQFCTCCSKCKKRCQCAELRDPET